MFVRKSNTCDVGGTQVGWKHWDTVKELEQKRKVKSEAYWAKKKDAIKVCLACVSSVVRPCVCV